MASHPYLAHIASDGREQTVAAHLQETAALCSSFAAEFGQAQRGAFLGMAHDIGKNSDAFQKRLLGGPRVDHATAGALECAKRGESEMACCVVGHHGGMPDFGNPNTDYPGAPTCTGRIKKAQTGNIPPYHWEGELPSPGKKPPLDNLYSISMWTRMMYSCLVDADFLNTESFMAETVPLRSGYDSLPELLRRLNDYIAPWFPGNTELNRNRCAILSACLRQASRPRGIYSLTVPTGGGKTVSSLAFGLKHAVENGMKRVIYVIPYTSIIEQNAQVFRDILGESNVVEHHSGVSYDDEDETNPNNHFQRLASENWDAPVIVTTAVQFFESLYSNRPSQCRKLHNIANSVVIFDEAQMIPTCHLLPCVGAMASLVSQFRSTIVLCTATQPVLTDLFRRFYPQVQIQELCPQVGDYFQKFQRVTYRDGGFLSEDALAAELQQHNQVLCIVNTRKAAQSLYALLPQDGRFHLSTLMYPAHRRQVLDTVRQRLKEGLPCRVVSTSLIEAGVDVDFRKRKFIDVQNIFHKMEQRTLVAAYKFYCGKNLEDAHTAEADTRATYEVLMSQLDRYPDLQNDVTFLSDYSSFNKNVDFAGRMVYDDKGVEVFNFGKYKGMSVADVLKRDPGYYSWILNSDFTLNTKAMLTKIRLREITQK